MLHIFKLLIWKIYDFKNSFWLYLNFSAGRNPVRIVLLEYLISLDFLISSTEGSEPVGYYVNTPIDGNLLYWKPIYLILQKTSQIIDPTNLSLCFVLYPCNWVFFCYPSRYWAQIPKFYFLKPMNSEYIEICY